MHDDKPLTVEEINGKKWSIYVSPDGEFWTRAGYGEERLEAKTLAMLKDRIKDHMKKQGLQIPVTVIQDSDSYGSKGKPAIERYRFVDCFITGLHSSLRQTALLKLDVAGRPGQSISIDYNDEIHSRLSLEEQTEYVTLAQAEQDASAAFKACEQRTRINADKTVKDYLAAKEAEMKEPSPAS